MDRPAASARKRSWAAHGVALLVLGGAVLAVRAYASPRNGPDSGFTLVALAAAVWFAAHAVITTALVAWQGRSAGRVALLHAGMLIFAPASVSAGWIVYAKVQAGQAARWTAEAPNLLRIESWTLEAHAAHFRVQSGIDGRCHVVFDADRASSVVAHADATHWLAPGPGAITLTLDHPPPEEPDTYWLSLDCEPKGRKPVRLTFASGSLAPRQSSAFAGSGVDTYSTALVAPRSVAKPPPPPPPPVVTPEPIEAAKIVESPPPVDERARERRQWGFDTGLVVNAISIYGPDRHNSAGVPMVSPPVPAAGVQVVIRDSTDEIVARGLTNGEGELARQLAPGDYTVVVAVASTRPARTETRLVHVRRGEVRAVPIAYVR